MTDSKGVDLVLFDDAVAQRWLPFALTRPAGELLLGALTFRERLEQYLALTCVAHIVSPWLQGFLEPGAPPARDAASLSREQGRLFLSSRVLPGTPAPFRPPAHSAHVLLNDRVVGYYAAPGQPAPPADFFLDPDDTAVMADDTIELAGDCVEKVWDLVLRNAEQLVVDYGAAGNPAPGARLPAGVAAIGFQESLLRCDPDVTFEPDVVLDFTGGPIWISAGCTVRAFTRLEGPAFVGRKTTLLGGCYSGITVGPVCRVHGEMEEAVVLGYSNKAHDGFLGHAYLGRWVNLGALTTNSDLKNNYGPVRLTFPDGTVDTGTLKLGCLIGDHVKTGIGTMLGTGTVVGAGSNLFGPSLPPHYVPPFSWGGDGDLQEYDIERFLRTAATVMGRRGLQLTDAQAATLREAWEQSRPERTGQVP